MKFVSILTMAAMAMAMPMDIADTTVGTLNTYVYLHRIL